MPNDITVLTEKAALKASVINVVAILVHRLKTAGHRLQVMSEEILLVFEGFRAAAHINKKLRTRVRILGFRCCLHGTKYFEVCVIYPPE